MPYLSAMGTERDRAFERIAEILDGWRVRVFE
jgi:hypothetical protein